jgi:hypothetical protein
VLIVRYPNQRQFLLTNDENVCINLIVVLSYGYIVLQENPLIIECFNFSSNGKHDLVGKIVKSVAELENMYHRQNCEHFFVPASNAHECHSKEVKFVTLEYLQLLCYINRFSF